MPAMVDLLRDIAVDPKAAVGGDNPLRQVVVNTHSPSVVQCVPPDDLVYLELETVFRGGARGRVASILAPPNTWRSTGGNREVAKGKLRPYLRTSDHRQLWLEFVS
jgi:hypothetical protein